MNIKYSFALVLVCCITTFARTFYFDAVSGNDDALGTTPSKAWKTSAKFNGMTFLAGDTARFKCGTVFPGTFQAKGSGVSGNPIVVDSFGTGPLPLILGGGVPDAFLVSGVEYWEINDLEITNTSAMRPDYRRNGIHLTSAGGTRHHIVLRGLYVHDVNGNLTKGSKEGSGIFFDGGAFDDLLIENCHVLRCDRNGITQESSSRSTRVVIRGNLLEDIGGDGIKLWGCNGGLVEHNVLRGGLMRAKDASAGMWAFNSDDCVFQFNEVSGMKTAVDGMAFDVDYLTRGTIFQYNYSHDNEGGFMLMCSPGNSYCDRFVVRADIALKQKARRISLGIITTSAIISAGQMIQPQS